MFELHLTSFTNERGLNKEGNCCNGVRTSSPYGNGFVCSSSCNTFFTICLSHFQINIPDDPKCTFGFVTTDVLGGNNVTFENSDSFTNPIRFQFENVTWPGTFSLIIESWHDATLEGVRQDSPREKISRLAVQRQLQKGPEWSHYIHDDMPRTMLEYKYRVMCNPDYYGPGCSILCKPRDDHSVIICATRLARKCVWLVGRASTAIKLSVCLAV